MKVTTEDCKQFLADILSKHPEERYGNHEPPAEDMERISNPKKWKRFSKSKPDEEEYFVSKASDKTSTEKYPTISADKIKFVRRFYCDIEYFDTGVAFLVLELHDGTLLLGEYVGD